MCILYNNTLPTGRIYYGKVFGKLYGILVLHLDKVNFLPDWQERDTQEAVAIVKEFIKKQDGGLKNMKDAKQFRLLLEKGNLET